MDDISPSDLKTILHSKRANLYYLERCRVLVNGGRIEYVTEQGQQSAYWNIPIANTTCVLLGSGTSITQAAMRELAKAGVMIGFCGGGGSPLFAANEVEHPVSWLSPQSEYRPTQYLQQWVSFWFDDAKRCEAAKSIQQSRFTFLEKQWLGHRPFVEDFKVDANELRASLDGSRAANAAARDVSHVLTLEAQHSKLLYKLAARATQLDSFTRAKRNTGTDAANRFLDHGNYLAYGLGATAAWVLGLPHGLAVLHGKTRRGGLVFDIADLVKDALILPQAFMSARDGDTEMEFRQACIENLSHTQALDFMIETVQAIAASLGHKTLVESVDPE